MILALVQNRMKTLYITDTKFVINMKLISRESLCLNLLSPVSSLQIFACVYVSVTGPVLLINIHVKFCSNDLFDIFHQMASAWMKANKKRGFFFLREVILHLRKLWSFRVQNDHGTDAEVSNVFLCNTLFCFPSFLSSSLSTTYWHNIIIRQPKRICFNVWSKLLT